MIDLDAMLPRVLPFVPGAPDPLVFQHLREAARDLCDRARFWLQTDTLPIAAPDFEQVLTIPDVDVVAIKAGSIDGGCPLEPKTVAELDDIRPGWAEDTCEAEARYVTQLEPGAITVYPRQAGTLTLRLVLRPSLVALSIPDWLVSQHGTALGRGAAGRILVLPNQEYGSPAIGATMIAEFGAYLDTWSVRGRKGQTGGRLRTKPQPF